MPSRIRAILSLLVLLLAAAPAVAQDKITLRLKHLHQFQFAGYYAALEQGYYREAGLDVRILEGADGNQAERDAVSYTHLTLPTKA